MADEIKRQIEGVEEVTLTQSGGGVFEITVDGKLVFSKKQLGRFPETEEALDLIRAAS